MGSLIQHWDSTVLSLLLTEMPWWLAATGEAVGTIPASRFSRGYSLPKLVCNAEWVCRNCWVFACSQLSCAPPERGARPGASVFSCGTVEPIPGWITSSFLSARHLLYVAALPIRPTQNCRQFGSSRRRNLDECNTPSAGVCRPPGCCCCCCCYWELEEDTTWNNCYWGGIHSSLC